MLKTSVGALLLVTMAMASDTAPYNGGNQFGSYYTNANYINSFLSQVNSTVSPACSTIPGIGLPILAIKQVLQNVDSSLSFNNSNTAAKVIFFKEKKNTATYQTSYKLVAEIKTFSSSNYLAIEGIYKQVGYPAFDITTYYLDSDLGNIKAVLGEYTVDSNAYVGCGDVKSTYSQANPDKTSTTPVPNGDRPKFINAVPGSNNANGGAAPKSDVDPNVVAQIIKLLQSSNK